MLSAVFCFAHTWKPSRHSRTDERLSVYVCDVYGLCMGWMGIHMWTDRIEWQTLTLAQSAHTNSETSENMASERNNNCQRCLVTQIGRPGGLRSCWNISTAWTIPLFYSMRMLSNTDNKAMGLTRAEYRRTQQRRRRRGSSSRRRGRRRERGNEAGRQRQSRTVILWAVVDLAKPVLPAQSQYRAESNGRQLYGKAMCGWCAMNIQAKCGCCCCCSRSYARITYTRPHAYTQLHRLNTAHYICSRSESHNQSQH